jgi:hypothetical protein
MTTDKSRPRHLAPTRDRRLPDFYSPPRRNEGIRGVAQVPDVELEAKVCQR